jgi:hypothetical protein
MSGTAQLVNGCGKMKLEVDKSSTLPGVYLGYDL